MDIGKPVQSATNAFDIKIDGMSYRVACVEPHKFFIWTWTGCEWADVEVKFAHVDAIAREISGGALNLS